MQDGPVNVLPVCEAIGEACGVEPLVVEASEKNSTFEDFADLWLRVGRCCYFSRRLSAVSLAPLKGIHTLLQWPGGQYGRLHDLHAEVDLIIPRALDSNNLQTR